MIITNNSKSIELPADLKKAIDKVRVQLEVEKGELLILKKARYSENGSVEQLIRERQFLTKETGDLKKSIVNDKKEFESVSGILEKSKKEFADLDAEIKKGKEKIKDLEALKIEFEDYKEQKESELFDKSNELAKRELEIVKKEVLAQEKLDEFKNFMQKHDNLE